MGANAVWVIPGAPLKSGAGWRLWYSWPGRENRDPPQAPVVRRGEREVAIMEPGFDPLPDVEGVQRRMGVQTIRLEDREPGALYELRVPEVERPLRLRSLPGPDADELNLLVASCFWREADKEGHYGAAVADLERLTTPAFKILMGDQLYQDFPLRLDVWHTPAELFSSRYADYWGDPAYQQVLCSSPNFFACDDHEFWNNYPETQIQVPHTWPEKRRQLSCAAAQDTYLLYQRGANPDRARHYSFKSAGVSFFVADTRSERTRRVDSPCHFFSDEQRAALDRWVGKLTGPGLLVLPQPLFQKEGDWKDLSLANFAEDYSELCGYFERALGGETGDRRPHDVLVVTGDIHTGRLAAGTITGSTDRVYEFVASPTSLVGPLQGRHKPAVAPGKLRPQHRRSWTVDVFNARGSPTIDNHVGVIRISPGRNRRLRFGLELWRVRPHDDRPFWNRALGWSPPHAPLTRLFAHELELR